MSEHCPNPSCGRPVPPDQAFPWCAMCGVWFPESMRLQLLNVLKAEAEARMRGKDPWAKFRAQVEVEETCARCGTRFRASARRDNLGFRKLECPTCHRATVVPLPWGYRLTYWVALSVFAFGLVQEIQVEGRNPGIAIVLLTFLLLQAVVKDLVVVYRQWTSAEN